MATAYHNLSDYDFNSVPNAEKMKFGIVVSEWSERFPDALPPDAKRVTVERVGGGDENARRILYEYEEREETV